MIGVDPSECQLEKVGEGQSWWIWAELLGMLGNEKGAPFSLSWEELVRIFSRIV